MGPSMDVLVTGTDGHQVPRPRKREGYLGKELEGNDGGRGRRGGGGTSGGN